MTRIQSPSSCLLLLSMVLGTLLLDVRSGAGQSIAGSDGSLRAAVATQAMLHNWRANKTRENRLRVTEMALAVDLHKRSVPSDEIVRRVRNFRDSIDAAGPTGFVETTLTALGLGVGAGGMQALGTALGWSNPLTIGARTGMAAFGAYTFNSWYEGEDDATFQQLDFSLESKIREYVDLYHADPAFREAADDAVTPRWHFSPNDDVDVILLASPDFALHVDVQSLRDAVGDQARAVDRLRDMAEDRLNAIQRDIGDTATGLTSRLREVGDDVEGFITETRGRWAAERIRQRTALDVANAHASLGLAANLIGLHDPRLGRQVSAVSGAAFGVHAGVRAFETAVELGANMTLATTALTGNFVGAALSLVGAFSDTPSPEQMLMEQMQQLSRQVDQLRTEMHDRFDRVDARLLTILDTVTDGFRDVQNRLDELEGNLGIANARLLALAQGQRDIQELIVTQTEILRSRLERLILTVNGCSATPFPVSPDETDLDRQRCIAAFGELVASLHLSQAEIGHPDQLVDRHFKQFAQVLNSGGDRISVNDVVGPDAWVYVVVLLEEYLRKRPVYAERFADEIAERVGDTLVRRRSDLRRYMAAIREDMRRFHGGSGQSVIGSVLQEARNDVASLRAAVSSIADEWYADETLSGVRVVRDADGRVVRDADGRVMPEVRFEDEVPEWRPLSEFYGEYSPVLWALDCIQGSCDYNSNHDTWFTGGQAPEWLRLHSRQNQERLDCGPTMSWTERLRGRTGLLSNIALEFLFLDETAPARLGMGYISYCIRRSRNFATVGNRYGSRAFDLSQLEMVYEFDFGEYCPVGSKVVRWPVLSTNRFAASAGRFADLGNLVYSLMMGWITYARERVDDAAKERRLSGECWNSYLEQFEEKRGDLSEYVRRGLGERPEIARSSQRTVALAQAIQSWIAVAFDRARVRVGVVDDTVAGRVGLPDVAAMLQDDELYPWKIADQAEHSIDQLEAVLRSRVMRDAVEYGFGHRLLTDSEFAVLGDLAGGRAEGPAEIGDAR